MLRAVQYGIITGIICALWLTLSFVLNWQDSRVGWMVFVFLAAGIFLAEWQLKSQQADKQIEFKPALKEGLKTALLAALFFGLGSFIYYKFIDTGFAERYLNEAEKYFRAEGKSEKEVAAQMSQLKGAFTLFGAITRSVFFTLFSGVLISAIVSLIICKKS